MPTQKSKQAQKSPKNQKPRSKTGVSQKMQMKSIPNQNRQSGVRVQTQIQNLVVPGSELCFDVSATSSFTARSDSIQPGNSDMFPWLSTIALKYQQYRFKKLQFRYVQRTNYLQIGSLHMAHEPNTYDLKPSSSSQISQMRGAREGPLLHNMIIPIQCDRVWRYTRANFTRLGEDLKTYDFGNLLTATDGANPVGISGRVYVDYELELKQANTFAINATNFRTVYDQTELSLNQTFLTEVPIGLFGTILHQSPLMGLVYTPTTVAMHKGSYRFSIGFDLQSSSQIADIRLSLRKNSGVIHTRVIKQATGDASGDGLYRQALRLVEVVDCAEGDIVDFVASSDAAGTIAVGQSQVMITPL